MTARTMAELQAEVAERYANVPEWQEFEPLEAASREVDKARWACYAYNAAKGQTNPWHDDGTPEWMQLYTKWLDERETEEEIRLWWAHLYLDAHSNEIREFLRENGGHCSYTEMRQKCVPFRAFHSSELHLPVSKVRVCGGVSMIPARSRGFTVIIDGDGSWSVNDIAVARFLGDVESLPSDTDRQVSDWEEAQRRFNPIGVEA